MADSLDKLTVAKLLELAKERGVEIRSGAKKQEIIDALSKAEAPAKPVKKAEKAETKKPEKKAEKPEAKKPEKKVEKPEAKKPEKVEKTEGKKVKGKKSEKPEPKKVAEQKSEIKQPAEQKPKTKQPAEPEKAEEHVKPVQNVQPVQPAPETQPEQSAPEVKPVQNQTQPQNQTQNIKEGILEIMPDGFGFIRCDNFLPGPEDVYVSPMQIRRMNLKTGDIIKGLVKDKNQGEKFNALLYVNSVNGFSVGEAIHRKRFEDLTPVFPYERIHLETPGCGVSMRMVDLISPIGKGQRGMIVSQPKAGKTTLLKQIANAIKTNHPEMHIIILLIDERPEEVTDMKESIQGDNVEVIYSTFDELPENHKRVSEMVIERAKRLVEHQKDVVILLDSITRLARAYNLTCISSGRTLSGGLDPAALHMPKKFFGAARKMREGGSLTVLATALVDTGSRMDDVVFEEFKGTGNMELVLDRSLSERRIFPAIDLPKSSTRRDDLLLSQPEMEANFLTRKALNSVRSEDAVERIIQLFSQTKTNTELVDYIRKYGILRNQPQPGAPF